MEEAVVITIGGVLALNILPTRAVLAVSGALHGRARWLLAAIWIAPLFGAAVARVEARSARASSVQPRAEGVAQEGPLPLVLSTLEPRVARAAADFIDRTRRRVALVLKGAARLPENEKSLLIVFDTEDDDHGYVSVYCPEEGEFAVSSGMFIDAGCPHFVVVRADLTSIEPTNAHELTRSALTHLRLPKWLDEGTAVNTEIRLTGEKRLISTRRTNCMPGARRSGTRRASRSSGRARHSTAPTTASCCRTNWAASSWSPRPAAWVPGGA